MTYEDWKKVYVDKKSMVGNSEHLVDITGRFASSAKPGTGKITYDQGYRESRHREEIHVAEWLHNTFGGDIRVLNEKLVYNKKIPDYIWNKQMWDLKTISSEKAADSAIRHGAKQIADNPGGIILYSPVNKLELGKLLDIIRDRLGRSGRFGMKIIVLHEEGSFEVFKFEYQK